MSPKTSSQATAPAAPTGPVLSAPAMANLLNDISKKNQLDYATDKPVQFTAQPDGSIRAMISPQAAATLQQLVHPHEGKTDSYTSFAAELFGNNFSAQDVAKPPSAASKTARGFGAFVKAVNPAAGAGIDAIGSLAASKEKDHYLVITKGNGDDIAAFEKHADIFKEVLKGNAPGATGLLDQFYKDKALAAALAKSSFDIPAEQKFAGTLNAITILPPSEHKIDFAPDGKGNLVATLTAEQVQNFDNVLKGFNDKGAHYLEKDIWGSDRFKLARDSQGNYLKDAQGNGQLIYNYEDPKNKPTDREWDANQFSNHRLAIKGAVRGDLDDVNTAINALKAKGQASLEMPEGMKPDHGLPAGLKGPMASNRAPGVTFNS